jgi:hypothetical protein
MYILLCVVDGNMRRPTILQEVVIDCISKEDCQNSYGGTINVLDTVVCIQQPEGELGEDKGGCYVSQCVGGKTTVVAMLVSAMRLLCKSMGILVIGAYFHQFLPLVYIYCVKFLESHNIVT